MCLQFPECTRCLQSRNLDRYLFFLLFAFNLPWAGLVWKENSSIAFLYLANFFQKCWFSILTAWLFICLLIYFTFDLLVNSSPHLLIWSTLVVLHFFSVVNMLCGKDEGYIAPWNIIIHNLLHIFAAFVGELNIMLWSVSSIDVFLLHAIARWTC